MRCDREGKVMAIEYEVKRLTTSELHERNDPGSLREQFRSIGVLCLNGE